MLGHGVMFAQMKAVGASNLLGGGVYCMSPDQWDGHQPARDRIYAAVKGTDGGKPIDNLVVLTGDIHSSWAADLTQDPNNPIPELGGCDPLPAAVHGRSNSSAPR
ncbi:MAG TPA: alkaline phosphatase D family protein [Ideonella sp.]|uniref:alkaline phosphatase D family protein n=1 Tax=Ideonella sp. TaxID=1929293 RepID=UPI002E3388CF|nr:alkaline phosphatase D family protein [Ideonella sp.]HEX5687807.1 alkaline phosphatase D family protein [Ideonella sp.]